MFKACRLMLSKTVKQGSPWFCMTSFSTSVSRQAPVSDFLIQKITKEFDHMYDMNSDGFVDRADIVVFKRRLRQYMEEVKGQALMDTYKIGYDDYWAILHELADTNRDGRISREEWIQMWSKIIDSCKVKRFNSLPQWVTLMPASIFPVIDAKGDGVLDKEEYRQFWHIVGGYPLIDDIQTEEYFRHMTEDGKYEMNLERIQELYADFYLSDDPSTPGKYIGGPIIFL